MSYNLFIVESPFQLMSAIEANDYFKGTSTLIVKYNTEKDNDTQLKRIIGKFSNFQDIIEVISQKSNYDANLKLFRLLQKLQTENKDYDKIFIGEYRSYHMRKFLDVLDPRECYLLDDGNITINIVKYIGAKKDQYYFNGIKGRTKQFIYGLQSLYFGFRANRVRRDISIFTCFNVEYIKNHKIIRHNFNYFKSSSNSNILKDIVYFYGSNLKELGINEVTEVEYLRYVINYYKNLNLKLVYIAHRRDKESKLALISENLNIKIKKNIYPAEIELILSKERPRNICSFISSVLITLPQINSFNSVVSFLIPLENISNLKYRSEISYIIDEYKKNMKIVEIKLKGDM